MGSSVSHGVATGPGDSLAGRGRHLPEGSAQAAAGCHRLLNSSTSRARLGVVERRLERGIELGAIVEASVALADSHPDGLERTEHGEVMEVTAILTHAGRPPRLHLGP
jgi:hypothetical protein